SVTRAMYDAGFGSSRQLYESASSQLGMTPDQYRRGAVAVPMSYTTVATPVGRMLVAASERGLCAVRFADSDTELETGLRREFPFATRRRNDTALSAHVDALQEMLRGASKHDLPLDIQATAFQLRVWKHLQSIPRGKTESYQEVAAAIGQPTAARAV